MHDRRIPAAIAIFQVIKQKSLVGTDTLYQRCYAKLSARDVDEAVQDLIDNGLVVRDGDNLLRVVKG